MLYLVFICILFYILSTMYIFENST